MRLHRDDRLHVNWHGIRTPFGVIGIQSGPRPLLRKSSIVQLFCERIIHFSDINK